MTDKNKMRHMTGPSKFYIRAVFLMFTDLMVIFAAYFLALLLRFDLQYTEIPQIYLDGFLKYIPVYAILTVLIYHMAHLYSSLWRYAGFSEMIRIVAACGICFFAHALMMMVVGVRMPSSYYVFGIVLQNCGAVAIRFSYRIARRLNQDYRSRQVRSDVRRVMLIGAGKAGIMLLDDLRSTDKANDLVCCLIDDDPAKWGHRIRGVKVEGGREMILACAEKYRIDKIYLAIPSATAQQKRDILNICKETTCELRSLPGLYQLYKGEVEVSMMRDVSVEDLLGREPVKADNSRIFEELAGKTVLITGAGGSIGSELARQIAAHKPGKLVLFDVYENTVYDLQLQLKQKYPDLDLHVLIGSVRDSRRLGSVFAEYRPQVVFHAAAHKHVPLMEDSPCEAIKNNAIGTYKTAYAAMMHGCRRFVLISTDKAVNPTNIMGASKRICEMIVQSFDSMIRQGRAQELPQLFTHLDGELHGGMQTASAEDVRTEFVAVRFGNVLGSNGSVIPIFKRQIEQGGPVTVTHPDIIRYFMTIPEAVGLVLQASTYAHGGEIFVLDMGVAVKIDQLARNLIRLSGYTPDVDIKIEYTGLRPGEKLYEEKLMSEEGLTKTDNEMIFIGKPISFDVEEFLKRLEKLMLAAYENTPDIREQVLGIVETYRPAGRSGSEEKGEAYIKQMQ